MMCIDAGLTKKYNTHIKPGSLSVYNVEIQVSSCPDENKDIY